MGSCPRTRKSEDHSNRQWVRPPPDEAGQPRTFLNLSQVGGLEGGTCLLYKTEIYLGKAILYRMYHLSIENF